MRSVDFQKCPAVPTFERDRRRKGEGFSMNARAWAKGKGEGRRRWETDDACGDGRPRDRAGVDAIR